MATQFAVDLVFKSQTQQLDQVANKIKKFERELAKLKGSDPFQGVEDSAKQAGQEIDRTKKKAESASGSFNKLGAVLGKLALAYTAIQATKYVFGKAAEIESQTRSIQVLTGSMEKAQGIIKQLQQYANVTPFTSTEIIETAKRLSAFGVTADKVVETTKRLGDIAGATGANLGELSLAYGQVMAKGRLQGEELLQFQERGVALQDELRKMYGLTGEEFAEAMAKGKISAEAVEVAVLRLTDAGGKYANGAISQSDTLAGKLSTLQDAFETLARNIGKFFEPVFKWMLDSVTKIINRLNDATVMQDEWRARSEADQRTRNKFGARALNPFDSEVSAYRSRLEKSLYSTNRGARSNVGGGEISAAPTPVASRAIPALSAGKESGSGGSSKKAKAEAEKAVKPLYISLVDLGKRLQAMGYTVKEHPAFGGVGKHSPNSYHYYGEALDVTDWRGGDWKGRTKGLINSLRGSGAGFAELLGPGDKGHDTHAHIAAQGGKVKLTDKLAQLLGLPSGGERGDQALGVMNQAFDEMVRKIEAAREAWARMKQGITDSNVLLKEQVTDQNEINRLVMEGLDPTAASEQVARQRELLNIHKEQAVALADLKGIEGLTTDEIKTKEAEINALYAERLQLQGQLNAGKDTAKGLADQQQKSAEASQAESDARGIASTITGGLKDVIKAAITGGDVKAALANMLSGIGDRLLDIAMRPLEDMLTKSLTGVFNPQTTATTANTMALQQLTMALQTASFGGGAGGFGGLGGLFGAASGGFGGAFGAGFNPLNTGGMLVPGGIFASGGSTPVNTPVLVGERGPELFVPGQSGGITNHQNLRSMMASGGAQQNGGSGSVTNLSFETVQIMDQEWIDRPQLEAAMAAASKRGAAEGERRALDKLKQSPSTRRGLGL